MRGIQIRGLDASATSRLRLLAAQHGRSIEEEAREILKQALQSEPEKTTKLGDAIRAYFTPLGGVELRLPPREQIRRPPELHK